MRELDLVPAEAYLISKGHDIGSLRMGMRKNDFSGLTVTKSWDDSVLTTHKVDNGRMAARVTWPGRKKYRPNRNVSGKVAATPAESQPATATAKALSNLPAQKADLEEGNCMQELCVWQQDCQQVNIGDQWVDEYCSEGYNTGECYYEEYDCGGDDGGECGLGTDEGCACELWGLGCAGNQPGDPEEDPDPVEDPKDPCNEKNKINNRRTDSTINSQINVLSDNLGSTDQNVNNYEYGYAQRLNTLFDGSPHFIGTNILKADHPSNENGGEVDIPFSWNDNDGYTIGVTHSHVGGTTISPGDVVQLVAHWSNSQLQNSSDASKSFYIQNAYVSVVTSGAEYMVTIKDWDALVNIYNSYSGNTQQMNDVILNDMNNLNKTQEAAMISLFGTALNFYKRETEGNGYLPQELDSGGSYATSKNCND